MFLCGAGEDQVRGGGRGGVVGRGTEEGDTVYEVGVDGCGYEVWVVDLGDRIRVGGGGDGGGGGERPEADGVIEAAGEDVPAGGVEGERQ